jgi:hypothetical protein
MNRIFGQEKGGRPLARHGHPFSGLPEEAVLKGVPFSFDVVSYVLVSQPGMS